MSGRWIVACVALTGLAAVLLVATMIYRHSAPAAGPAVISPPIPALTIDSVGKPFPNESALIQSVYRELAPTVELDFRMKMRPFKVMLYRNHEEYARVYRRLEGVSLEGPADRTGNIVHGIMPIYPPMRQARHAMAHILTEWVMDGLTHNNSNREPDPSWLYDGLAEFEADRISPPVPCDLHGHYPLPLRLVTDPDQWQWYRGTHLRSLEYCEAKTAASTVVSLIGWGRLVGEMRHSASWSAFARKAYAYPTHRPAPS